MQHHGEREMDGFRILALSRIPRCAGCPRFTAIRESYARGGFGPGPAPEAARDCRHQVCAPLVPRLFAAPAPARALPRRPGLVASA